ncbi:MAG TPA: YdeI/OmpD-associated family protein [Solirubrobacteraceae bacterium]|jgi:uncharacterized protein YdeI (YjbR/CyaY-like superfamily)|nr:YdeI/OmpD-associated family protein [Solirubrobacteraceae bacterium]
MASPSPTDDLPLLEFPDPQGWVTWLDENHVTARGAWLKFAKRGAPRPTVSYAEAVEVALCFGWIDSQVGRLDEFFYRQRFTPRGSRSRWSQINRAKATDLLQRGLMRPAGLAEVERARRDGRWESAYASPSKAVAPEDFLAALRQNPQAERNFASLTSANRYAFIFRIEEAKRPETRARRIVQYVEMLAAGRSFH